MYLKTVQNKHPKVKVHHSRLRNFFDLYSAKEIKEITGYSIRHINEIKNNKKWFESINTVIRWLSLFDKHEKKVTKK